MDCEHLKFEQSSRILNTQSVYFLAVLDRSLLFIIIIRGRLNIGANLGTLVQHKMYFLDCMARIPPYALLI